jgi:hypothetical protein
LSSESSGESPRYRLETLSKEWSKSGGHVGRTDAASCIVTRCRAMAFVALRTRTGPRPVCLKHFERLDAVGVLVA